MPVGSYRVVSLLLPTLRGGKGKGKDRNSLKPKGAGEALSFPHPFPHPYRRMAHTLLFQLT
jgi:hypothetical protein